MTAPPVFARRTVVWLLFVGCLSFAGALLLIVMGEDLFPTATVEANAFSESAIGHKALVETLRRLGIPVLVSRSDSPARAGRNDLLIVAEPPGEQADDAYLKGLLRGGHVLFVLPKWLAAPTLTNRRWAGEVVHVPPGAVNELLQLAAPGGWAQSTTDPITWRSPRFARTATLADPQLMVADRLTPIIDSNHGMLLGEDQRGDRRLWVLSDPDLLSNHGLRRGDNALLAVGIIQALLPPGGAVVVDEVIHGFRRDPNLWRAMAEFPFVIVTVNALAALAVLVWAALGRFGAPAPAAAPLKAGRATLIGNAAGLLRYGGHGGEIIRRYLAVTVADVARRVHAPAQPGDPALADWLERIGTARHVRMTARALRRDAETAAARRPADERLLLRIAGNLYRWKQEMLHGPGTDSLGRRASETAGAQGGRRPGGGH